LRRELDEAIQNSEDVEEWLAEAKKIDENLSSKLLEGKRKLEAVKAKDTEIAKLLEDAQKLEEKLMNKVSPIPLCTILTCIHVCTSSRCHSIYYRDLFVSCNANFVLVGFKSLVPSPQQLSYRRTGVCQFLL